MPTARPSPSGAGPALPEPPMPLTTLVSTADLEAHLGDAGWVVFDCRHALTDLEAGARAYAAGHIPGARFAPMETALSGPKNPGTGRHPLPDWGVFVRWLAAQGVSRGAQVIAYDDRSGSTASRLWWMLRTLGHEAVAVLDGGFTAWSAEGRPVDDAVPAPAPGDFAGSPRCGAWLELPALLEAMAAPGTTLIDARDPDRFAGRTEPIDPAAGHIPGARNLPLTGNLGPDGRFLLPEALRARFLDKLGAGGVAGAVHYCGSGVSACHNMLAMAVAGLEPGRLYPGSWSQWCADPARPQATGPDGEA